MHRARSSRNASCCRPTTFTIRHCQWLCVGFDGCLNKAQEFHNVYVPLSGPRLQFYTIKHVAWNPAVTHQESPTYLNRRLSLLSGESCRSYTQRSCMSCVLPTTQGAQPFNIHCAAKLSLMLRNMARRPFRLPSPERMNPSRARS